MADVMPAIVWISDADGLDGVPAARHDGHYRWHILSGQSVRSANGTIAAWYGAAIDVDDSRRRHDLVARSERLLEVLATGGSLDSVVTCAVHLLQHLLGGEWRLDVPEALSTSNCVVGAWSFDLGADRMTWSDEVCEIHEVAPARLPACETRWSSTSAMIGWSRAMRSAHARSTACRSRSRLLRVERPVSEPMIHLRAGIL